MLFVYANIDSYFFFFFFSSRRRHTRCSRDWSSDVCSSDLPFMRRRDGSSATMSTRVHSISVVVSFLSLALALGLLSGKYTYFTYRAHHLGEARSQLERARNDLGVLQIGRASCRERV